MRKKKFLVTLNGTGASTDVLIIASDDGIETGEDDVSEFDEGEGETQRIHLKTSEL